MTCFFLKIIFEQIWIFESVLIPCKLNVLFIKMITISNHNQKFIFYILISLNTKLQFS
jgi:hypothetical protein